MSSSSDKRDLHQLVNELFLSISLHQHRRVAQLSGEISRLLITTLDDELDEIQENADDDNGQDNGLDIIIKEILDIVNVICDRLNRFSRIIDIYHEVVEFVQLQDLACLSRMVGAIKANHMTNRRHVDFDEMAKTLRQSKILLREINSIKRSPQGGSEGKDSAGCDGDIWLDRKDIARVDAIGLASTLIDLNDTSKRMSASRERPPCVSGDKLKNLSARTTSGHLKLMDQLQSQWFCELLELLFDRVYYYPFDRFTVLISIYIVAVESGHEALQHLVGLLVDQIHHQETNSCHLDDLMQLTQVGSFWLSHRRRFLVSFRQRADMGADVLNKDSQLDEDDEEDVGEGEDFRYRDSGEDQEDSDESDHKTDGLKSIDFTSRQIQQPGQPLDLRLELRKLIDSELLFGSNCPLCDRQPSGDPLEPVHLSRCAQCSLDPDLAGYCSLSYERIEWLSLASVMAHLAPGLSALWVLQPAEWLRQMSLVASAEEEQVAASRRGRPGKDSRKDDGGQETTVERMDISDTFERLTMLRERSHDRQPQDEPHDEDPSSTSSSLDESVGDDNQGHVSAEKLLRAHLRERLLAHHVKQSSAGCEPSQSLAMIRRSVAVLEANRQQPVAVCSSDLVICDSLNELVKLKLWLVRPTIWIDRYATVGELAPGRGRGRRRRHQQASVPTRTVLACQSRSAISQLQLGCGRLFAWPQLARSTGGHWPPGAELTCPKCAGHLFELANLC